MPTVVAILDPENNLWSEALGVVRGAWPGAKLIAVGVANTEEALQDCVGGGTNALVLDHEPLGVVEESIAVVESGGFRFPPAVASTLMNRLVLIERRIHGTMRPWVERLSSRERQILELIATGRTNKEICLHLGIEIQTVKNHVTHLLRKLNVRSRADAARQATRMLPANEQGNEP